LYDSNDQFPVIVERMSKPATRRSSLEPILESLVNDWTGAADPAAIEIVVTKASVFALARSVAQL
jgi:hypothetical protein